MKLSVGALWVLAALTSVASAQQTGDIPPALVWNKLKGNCPSSLDWPSLRGTVVVVSLSPGPAFPQDIAEWNEIAQKFQGEQILFIRVVTAHSGSLENSPRPDRISGKAGRRRL